MTEETDASGLGQGPRVLDERYELQERCGAGGMAEVWRARDLRLERTVAVKLLAATSSEDADRRRKIEREARALAASNHPNVVAVYDYGEAPSGHGDVQPYLVMEFVDGPDLHQYLEQRGPLPVEEARELVTGVLAGVSHAHGAGIVHGDLKPANIFVSAHGPKVGDFGVARILDQETGNTTVAATPTFAAPEVLKGERATTASDVYSAGCVAFQILAGRPPFEGANAWDVAAKHLEAPVPRIRKLRPDVTSEIDGAIGRAMDKNPKRRFADAAALAGAFGSDVGATQPAPPVMASPPPAQSATVPITGRVEALAAGGWWGRIAARARTSPNGRLLLLILIPLLLLIAFLAMRSPGATARTMPDVVGDPYQDAAGELRLDGFKVNVSFQPIAQGEPGLILDTIPAAEAEVAAGEEVHLIAGVLASTPSPTVQPFTGGGGDPDEGRGEREGRGEGKDKKDDD